MNGLLKDVKEVDIKMASGNKKLRDVVDELSYEELVKMRKDLLAGGQHLKKFVSEKLAAREQEEIKVCAVCGTPINPHYIDDFTLTFGRFDFKKRAHFCGLDCLNYFISSLGKKDKERLMKSSGPRPGMRI